VGIIKGIGVAEGPVVFMQDILTNGVNEGSEALGLAYAAFFPQRRNNPNKCVLAEVIDAVGGNGAGAHHDPEKGPKIANKMLLRGEIALAEPFDIPLVEREEFQAPSGVLTGLGQVLGRGV
jgi:hypothetical protein